MLSGLVVGGGQPTSFAPDPTSIHCTTNSTTARPFSDVLLYICHDVLPFPRQGVIRTEAFVSGVILLAAPLLLRSWAKIEADHHDTLECRTVLQTYLIAAAGCLCSVSASVAGNPILAVVMQVKYPDLRYRLCA